ncbi:MAG: DUF1559 domain-containing protein [Isosphaeraceae bacterium]
MSRRRTVVTAAVLGLPMYLCLALPMIFLVQIPLDLAFGWALYLQRVVPNVSIAWDGVLTGAICLFGFAWGGHLFLRWLSGQMREGPWQAHWTASIVGLLLLMFVAGLAAGGVAHQAGWLLSGREPFLDSSSMGGQAARRIQSTNNLRQLGRALHEYHGVQGHFPAGATFDAEGRPMHSWITALLPFLEREDVFRQIDLERPWDDPANSAAFRASIAEFIVPRTPTEALPNGYAPAHYAANARVLGGDQPRTIDRIPDGASNTILAGEVAGRFRAWGDPINWRDPALGINRSPDGFGSPFPGGANMLMADGSVRFLKDTIDPKVLRALATPDGGETPSPDEY